MPSTYRSGAGPFRPFELLWGTNGVKKGGQDPKTMSPRQMGTTPPDEPTADVSKSRAPCTTRRTNLSLRSQTCRKADAWGIPESQFVAHCGVPKIEMCTALP